MIERHTASAADVTRALTTCPAYYRPVLDALHCGVSVAVALPGTEPYALAFDRPTIAMICDDAPGNEHRRGPARFEGASLRRIISTCRAGLITSCEPILDAYEKAAATAVLARRHVLIVETRPEVEADWLAFVQTTNPRMGLLIATVKPEGRA